jgi:hypothetical protein
MSATLLEVIGAAKARRVPLVAECSGYLVLAAADQLAHSPRVVAARDLVLEADGSLRLLGQTPCAPEEVEASLRALLDALLLVSSGANGSLFRVARRSPGAGIERLVRELEAALIPANRGAAKRSLARLCRDAERALALGIAAEAVPVPAPARADAQPSLPPVAKEAPPPPPAAVAERVPCCPEPTVQRSSERRTEVVPNVDHTPCLGSLVAERPATRVLAVTEEGELTERMPEVELAEIEALDEVVFDSDEPPSVLCAHADLPRKLTGMVTGPSPLPDPVQPAARLERAPSRRSDLDELLGRFQVEQPHSDRDLCRELKDMAGVDLTPHAPASVAPPLVTSATPPPVAAAPRSEGVEAAPQRPSVRRRLVPLVTIAVVGFGALAIGGPRAGSSAFAARFQDVREVEAAPAARAEQREAAAAVAEAREAPVPAEADSARCSAILRVTDVPTGAEVRLRPASTESSEAPLSAKGPGAAFPGLRCGEAYELSVRLPASDGRAVWRRFPISAEQLAASTLGENGELSLSVR